MFRRKMTVFQKFGGFFKYIRIKILKTPILINLEVTKKCNAKCDICDYWKTESESGFTDYLPVVQHINPLVVTLVGGEPLLRKDLPDIIRRIKENTNLVYISLITNGSLLTEEKAKKLWKAGLDQLSISLDYLGIKHDEQRGIKGLYTHISNLIPRLSAASDNNIVLNTIIMKDNLDQIVDIAIQAYKWDVMVSYSTYTALKTGNKAHIVTPETLKRLRAVIAEILKLKSDLGNIMNSDYYLKKIPIFLEAGSIGGCQAGRCFVHVTPDGYLKPCAELPAFCHHSEYKERPDAVNCDKCWSACRGESEAPLTLKRIMEFIR
ncbi:hypothetical protein AMJ80_00875 [bacterium SM23_31]|nr:MAG: hypothetical protein AMJ80_00875 [bacterium SM23_31]